MNSTDNHENILSTTQQAPDLVNIYQATEQIIRHYDRDFKNIKFVLPTQIIDGSQADFIDGDSKSIIATCRLRTRNQLHINTSTGNIYVDVKISDITYSRENIDLKIN